MSIFSEADLLFLKSCIESAEKSTSGEIRLHVEAICPSDIPEKRAHELFDSLGMRNTKQKNAILIYLASESRKFVLWGDQGIHDRVGQSFWDEQAQFLSEQLRGGFYLQGMQKVIENLGKALGEYFPWDDSDVDELDNSISIG
jgi:uncharacterized membrane protein